MPDRHAVRHPAPPGLPDVTHLPTPPRVAVIGGGIAGLAAATGLVERGVDITLFERNARCGGRVSGWPVTLRDGTRTSMSRGFHAFFRQYYNLRALLQRANPDALTPIADYPLWHRLGWRESFARMPTTPPWNALGFLLRSPTVSWRDLPGLRPRTALALTRVQVPETYAELDHLDASTFLHMMGFPTPARELAFRVFSRSFFAPPSRLSAAELATMFHLYFLGSREGLLFDTAADCFDSALWQPLANHLREQGAQLRLRCPVESIEPGTTRRFLVRSAASDAEEFDALVLAVDVPSLRRLVECCPHLGDAGWRRALCALPTAPPLLVSRFWLDRPVRGDRPAFLGTAGFRHLDNISVVERYEHGAAEWARARAGAVVETHCYALPTGTTVDELRPGVLAELHEAYPETAAAGIIDERHELHEDCPLFAPRGHRTRPGVLTPDPDLVLAGDFTRIDLPVALMERAATTGLHAANTLLARWEVRGHDLHSVPTRGPFRLFSGARSAS